MVFLVAKRYRCIAQDHPWRRWPNRADRPLGARLGYVGRIRDLRVYPGASHGVPDTHKDQLNADLLAFLLARDS